MINAFQVQFPTIFREVKPAFPGSIITCLLKDYSGIIGASQRFSVEPGEKSVFSNPQLIHGASAHHAAWTRNRGRDIIFAAGKIMSNHHRSQDGFSRWQTQPDKCTWWLLNINKCTIQTYHRENSKCTITPRVGSHWPVILACLQCCCNCFLILLFKATTAASPLPLSFSDILLLQMRK